MRNILPAGAVAFLLGMGILAAQQPVPVRTEPQPAATVATSSWSPWNSVNFLTARGNSVMFSVEQD